MKKALFSILACIFMMSIISCPETEEEEKMNEVVAGFVSGLGRGWNLGNTLDATGKSGLESETSWGMPETTKEMIDAVAERGFKTIRIPVSWHNHIIDTNYTIDPEWMARVKTIVDWSLKAGMKVIINIHHDNLSEAQMSSTYGFCVPENNEDLKNQSLLYIKAIWKQVADYFKEYDERLIFEVLNEPRAVGKSYEWNGSGTSVSNANKIIREYEKAALSEIRASGGNNLSRYVMVPPYAASPNMTAGWSLPSDSVANKLIVSVHAYTPYTFCMSTNAVTSFGQAQKGEVDWLFKSLETSFINKGIPVVMGEASASDKNNTNERKKWAEYYYGKSYGCGIPVILWDNMVTVSDGGDINSGECHGWFKRSDCTWYFSEIINAMF